MKKVISITLALCLCLVCFVGCGEKPPEGYEGWKVKKLLNTVSYCVPTSWKQEKNNKDYHKYVLNDTTSVHISIDKETREGYTESIEIINEYEREKAAYKRGDYYTPSSFVRFDDFTMDGHPAYHYQLDLLLGVMGQKGYDGEIDNNLYDYYLSDCDKGILTIRVMYDREIGNPISEDEMNKFLESIQFKDFEAKEE